VKQKVLFHLLCFYVKGITGIEKYKNGDIAPPFCSRFNKDLEDQFFTTSHGAFLLSRCPIEDAMPAASRPYWASAVAAHRHDR
jgi:hypothetical protein